jgi:hypothetical protein
MTTVPTTTPRPGRASADSPQWFDSASCSLEDFKAVVEEPVLLTDYAHAEAVESNVLIYGRGLHSLLQDPGERAGIQAELIRALTRGPGIVVFKGAFPDTGVVDRATDAFNELIRAQKAAGIAAGDHFAKPGANDRVWGALDKLALSAPAIFAEYYSNDVLALISEAWLGPNYQVTSQVNVVNPARPGA